MFPCAIPGSTAKFPEAILPVQDNSYRLALIADFREESSCMLSFNSGRCLGDTLPPLNNQTIRSFQGYLRPKLGRIISAT
jgi:hypothetical protein